MIGEKPEVLKWLVDQAEGEYEAKPYRKHRSLSANNYYWKAVGEIAKYNHVSNARQHNLLLRRYGTMAELAGEKVYCFIPDSEEAENKALEDEYIHLYPTSKIRPGKPNFRAYILIKGSHEYKSDEMSRLIDGTIDEMKQMGLTPPPTREIAEALKRMQDEETKKRNPG